MNEKVAMNLEFITPRRAGSSLEDDFKKGMAAIPKSIPPKYFYDELGSGLFDQICDAPEYYPTRTEDRLLQEISQNLINKIKPDGIFELGSGTARKTRHILDACEEVNCFPKYHPIDVCPEVLLGCKDELCNEYDWLSVNPIVGDYMEGFSEFNYLHDRNLFLFLGGTIGNLSEPESDRLLTDIRQLMQSGDSLLIGADLVKSPKILHAAYNDSKGITAKFNLNLLDVLNRELKGNFDQDNFVHHALYNPSKYQIEMYLVCTNNQQVKLENIDLQINFSQGDSILTEVSRKFTKSGLEAIVKKAGFGVVNHFQSLVPEFSLIHLKPD